MASKSDSSPLDIDSQRVLFQSSQVTEGTTVVSPDFPSLVESYGDKRDLLVNPKKDDAACLGLEGTANGTNQNKLEIVLPVKEGIIRAASETVNSKEKNSIGGFSNPEPQGWRNLFPVPTPIPSHPPLKFTPPVDLNGKMAVDTSTVDFSKGIKRCQEYVVGFCVGKKLSFPAVKEAVSKIWKLKKEVSIKLHGNGAFVFEFEDDEDRRNVLEIGSFYISKNLFTVRPWSNMIESSISSIKTIPIWVLIYGVPLHMWDLEGLSLISSFLGKPILADDYTINRTRLVYARMCIEIDIDFKFPESIPLMIDGKIALELPVEYQWKPPSCEVCMVFGHLAKNCSKIRKVGWKPKKQDKSFEKVHTTLEAKEVLASKARIDVEVLSRDAEQTSEKIGGGMRANKEADASRVIAPTNVSSTGQGFKEDIHCTDVDMRCNMIKKTSSDDRGKPAKSPIKSASSAPKAAVTNNASNSKSAVIQGIEKGHKHRPFHLSSDFPYQWKDLSKDKVKEIEAASSSITANKVVCSPVKNQDAPTKSPIKMTSTGYHGAIVANAVKSSEDGNWKAAPDRKSPVKNAVIDKKGTIKAKGSDPCIKVSNTFKVLDNENQHSLHDQDGVLIEDCDEYNEDEFCEVESDKYTHFLAYEDKNKKTEKERSRLKWNGEIPNENLGKGQRSAARKLK